MVDTSRLIGGRYKILNKIAEGGMGAVYRAQHNLSKKTVALKILFEHIGKDEANRERFLREVAAPAQIGHDGIVEVTDAGFDTEDGSLFVAMELLEGETLRERLDRGGLTIDQLLDLFQEALDPLAAAHEKNIVHRDLKPENIFLQRKKDGSEVVKILDFGIARDLDASDANLTQAGIAMGTPHYMAPEQAMSAKDVTPGADVWAFGIMLYEAMTGVTPFDGETASAIVVHACTKAHAPLLSVAPQVPAPLAQIIEHTLVKEPHNRQPNCAVLLQQIRQVRAQLGPMSFVPRGGPGGPPMGGQMTGPMGGQGMPTPSPAPGYGTSPGPHSQGPNTAGTAVLPGVTPQPGFGSGPPSSGVHQSFVSPGPQGQQGFGTSPSQPGFGSNPSQPGFGTSPSMGAPSGFGAPGQPVAAQPYSQGSQGGQKSGMSVGLIAIAGIVGFCVITGVGGGIWAAMSDDDDSTENNNTNGTNGTNGTLGGNGTVSITTDVAAGELLVDNIPQGAATTGRQVPVTPGAHTLQIREAGQVVATAAVTVTSGQTSSVVLNRSMQPVNGLANNGQGGMQPVNGVPNNGQGGTPPATGPQQVQSGSLAQGDRTLRSGEFMDEYTFTWAAGESHHIEIQSTAFDTYLILKHPSGRQQDNDDLNAAQGTNAGLDFVTTESGVHHVLVTSFRPGETGPYQLIVR